MPQARLGITLDGYSAPLTAGNFAANVQDGVYNGHPVNASYASVLAGRGLQPGAALSLATECIAGFTLMQTSEAVSASSVLAPLQKLCAEGHSYSNLAFLAACLSS